MVRERCRCSIITSCCQARGAYTKQNNASPVWSCYIIGLTWSRSHFELLTPQFEFTATFLFPLFASYDHTRYSTDPVRHIAWMVALVHLSSCLPFVTMGRLLYQYVAITGCYQHCSAATGLILIWDGFVESTSLVINGAPLGLMVAMYVLRNLEISRLACFRP